MTTSGSSSTGIDYTGSGDESTTEWISTDSGPTDGSSSSTTTGGVTAAGLDHEPQTPIDVPGFVQEVLVDDFDGDDLLDVTIVADGADEVEVFLGDGAGDFVPTGSGVSGINSVGGEVGDFDGDGTPDVVTVSGVIPGRVHVLLSGGDGSLSEVENHIVGNQPNDVVVGDFDGDDDLDIVTNNTLDDTFTLLLNDGDAAFTPQPAVDTVLIPIYLLAEDVDGDTNLDLLLGGHTGLHAWLGDGANTFNQVTTAIDVVPVGFATADFNGDGNLDVFTGDLYAASGTIGVHHGNGDGTFDDPTTWDVDGSVYFAAVGDLDNDGNLDIAGSPGEAGTGGLHILLGTDDGSFHPPFVLDYDADFGAIAIADVDQNGTDDILVATTESDSGELIVWLAP